MALTDTITTPQDLWWLITTAFSTSGYRADGFFNWSYRWQGSLGAYLSTTPPEEIIEQALQSTKGTVWGHFSALMAWYKLVFNNDGGYIFDDPDWLLEWSKEQQKMYFQIDNLNTRRYKNDTSFSFQDFFVWLKNMSQDATKEVYDWYPSVRSPGWKAKLGPAKLYPGLLIIDAKGNAPNQYNPKGPLIQYTYNGGRKNAVTNTILIASRTVVVKDYAQYKATPGWRGQPYGLPNITSLTNSGKKPYQDWIDEMESTSKSWYFYSSGKSPIFNKLKPSLPDTIDLSGGPIPTINYDYRYYDYLN